MLFTISMSACVMYTFSTVNNHHILAEYPAEVKEKCQKRRMIHQNLLFHHTISFQRLRAKTMSFIVNAKLPVTAKV